MKTDVEIWGGVECTRNRVADHYLDQLKRSGHEKRLDDLDRIASLGFKRLRYPFLWERIQPRLDGELHWGWAEERVKRLKELELEPIAGFLHHGSGPLFTNLLDPQFPEMFARIASE